MIALAWQRTILDDLRSEAIGVLAPFGRAGSHTADESVLARHAPEYDRS
jgi:hypothetical protein